MEIDFNDSPISHNDEDLYNVIPFVKVISSSISKINNPIGTTIALTGAWGSGKSSILNLLIEDIRKNKSNITVFDFKPWWYRGDDELIHGFLQELSLSLGSVYGKKAKKILKSISKRLLPMKSLIVSGLQFTPLFWLAGFLESIITFFEKITTKDKPLDALFKELEDLLKANNKRILVVIDDLDRLSPDEALAMFRLVKSVGRLPNVIYLLAYDKELSEKIVTEKYPAEGAHYLEKIIQAEFNIPLPNEVDLQVALFNSVVNICSISSDEANPQFMNIFHDILCPLMTTPRKINRFINVISITWPAIKGEVNAADYLGMEAMRLYLPKVHKKIRSNRVYLCGLAYKDDREEKSRVIEDIISEFSDKEKEWLKNALKRIFPKLENATYDSGYHNAWISEKRICNEIYFDIYFRLSLGDDNLSVEQVNKLIENADNTNYIKNVFKDAKKNMRRSGKSMVPVYLDALEINANKIEKDKVKVLITTLFEIFDDVDLSDDDVNSFGKYTNTRFRYHWLIRALTRDRFSIVERTQIYMNAIKFASLGWIVEFVSSAVDGYRENKNGHQTSIDDCLVAEDSLPEFKAIALKSIESAAKDGSLIHHKDVITILYRWINYNDNNPGVVKTWTEKLFNEPSSMASLARGMISISFSMTAGDRVAQKSDRINVKQDTEVIDFPLFIQKLNELLAANKFSVADAHTVNRFLTAASKMNDDH